MTEEIDSLGRPITHPMKTVLAYRIVQIADDGYAVEDLQAYKIDGMWPWSKTERWNEWRRIFNLPFASVEEAQKWIDDKRKYPLVIKEPA